MKTITSLEFLSVSTECVKSNQVRAIVEFTEHINEPELHNVLIGSCGIDDLLNFEVSENGTRVFTLDFDPWSCGHDDNRTNSDLTTFSSSSELSFEVAVNSNGMVLVLGEHIAVITCNYQNDYVSVIDFTDLDMDYDGGEEIDGDSLSFGISRYSDGSYSEIDNSTVMRNAKKY